jgi:clan AA aspartic protease (TIGR02281 family)
MKKLGILLSIFILNVFYVSGQTKIKMEKENGVYYIPCKINGIPLRFVFDTGASDVSISLTEAKFMIKNGFLKKEDIGDEVYYKVANGDISKGTKILLRKIEFAGLTLSNVSASVVHESNSPLLLGQTAINKLGKIQLEGNTLTILNTSTSNSFDFSVEQEGKSTIANDEQENNPYMDVYKINWSGLVNTFTSAPITESPSLLSNRVGIAQNNEVTIIERTNEKYYRVKSDTIQGYMWAGWFKSPKK